MVGGRLEVGGGREAGRLREVFIVGGKSGRMLSVVVRWLK